MNTNFPSGGPGSDPYDFSFYADRYKQQEAKKAKEEALETLGNLSEESIRYEELTNKRDSQKQKRLFKNLTNGTDFTTEVTSNENGSIVSIPNIKTGDDSNINVPTQTTVNVDNDNRITKISNNQFIKEKNISYEKIGFPNIEETIAIPNSDISLKINSNYEFNENGQGIKNNTKTIKVINKGKEEKSITIDRKSLSPAESIIERPFEAPSSINFIKDQIKTSANLSDNYTLEAKDFNLSIKGGVIFITDKSDNLVFINDLEDRDYIFHPPENTKNSELKDAQELSQLSQKTTPADFNNAVEALEKTHGKDALDKETLEQMQKLENLKKSMLEAWGGSVGFGGEIENLFSNPNASKSKKEFNVLNEKQALAMLSSPNAIQLFRRNGEALYNQQNF
ncbi:MAG: hypothetical protein HRT47_06765 [Candidatus Caenarcaniphilales bacterium]|nr:hypothetical protein [Candidatus Caenarcaniphilales bacterium]